MNNTSFPKNEISILLLENISKAAVSAFKREGFHVEALSKALDEESLKKKVEFAHVIGIRSKTQLTKSVIASCKRLLAIGAFCIGTNQIDLEAAKEAGAPVFNAPFSNTRSVAELVISHCIALFRGISEKNRATHEGRWLKTAAGSHEARGKTLGIVGYGHIGAQVSIMAESMGMHVVYYDILDQLALGNARPVKSLDELLKISDIVTLHVPATKETEYMINKKRISKMKKGAHLINYSRGNVVDIDALKVALDSGKIAGAAIDVFPQEPKAEGDIFESPLQGLPNVILTPHIGGSTQEAQGNIGSEVANKLIKFINNGSTTSSVNMPEVELPILDGRHRILHFHRNVPGVLGAVNALFAEKKVNVLGQYLMTDPTIGYLVMDVSKDVSATLIKSLKRIPETIKTRILY